MYEELDALKIIPNGDRGLLVSFSELVTPDLSEKIQGFCSKIENASPLGLVELVSSYNSITIYYEPSIVSYREISRKIYQILLSELDEIEPIKKRIIHIPVLYGGETGPDLHTLSREKGLTKNEVIQLHTAPTYLIYMMGFLPGFPYMGGLDSRLFSPRLDNPRSSVPAGSVGIAHEQTGIYSVESPGGWKIIGRTPVDIFDSKQEHKAFLFRTGDYVKFYEINEETFKEIRLLQESSKYRVQMEVMG